MGVLPGFKRLFSEAAISLFPVAAVVLLLYLAATEYSWSEIIRLLVAMVFVYAGFVMFLLGSQMGLIPMGRLLGSHLPRLGSISLILVVTLMAGVLMTLAEPDLRVYCRVLSAATKGAVGQNAFVSVIALGVGLFLSLSIFRLVKGISVKTVMSIGFSLALALAIAAPPAFVAYAFNGSAVTTGPVTIPLMLSLGAGAAAVLEDRHSLSDSFGVIGVASLGPIIGVLILGLMGR